MRNGSRWSFTRGGYGSLKAAQADLDRVRVLPGLAKSDNPEGVELIAAMLAKVSGENLPLPDVEKTRCRLRAGQDLIGSLTVAEWLDRWFACERIRKSGVSRYETDVRVHLKPHVGRRRLDRLRVSHLSDMFTASTDANAEVLEQNAQRRAGARSWRTSRGRVRRTAPAAKP